MYWIRPVAAYESQFCSAVNVPVSSLFWSSGKQAHDWLSARPTVQLLVCERVWREKKHGKFQPHQSLGYFAILSPALSASLTVAHPNTDIVPVALWDSIDNRFASGYHMEEGVEYARALSNPPICGAFNHVSYKTFTSVSEAFNAWVTRTKRLRNFSKEAA